MKRSEVFKGVRAVIFDMDGVIVMTEDLHVSAERATCKEFGIEAPLTAWNDFKGRTAIEIACTILNNYSTGGISPKQFVDRKTEIYLDMIETELPEIEGATDFIAIAHRTFGKCALTTSSSKVIKNAVFDQLGLDTFFDVVVTGDQVTNGKPDPEPYLATVEKLSVPASLCVVIEDSDNGILSAKQAGCRVIGITTSFPASMLYDLGADLVVDQFSELSSAIHGLSEA